MNFNCPIMTTKKGKLDNTCNILVTGMRMSVK